LIDAQVEKNICPIGKISDSDECLRHPTPNQDCAIEEKIENADVDMTNYGVIVSPGTRKILRSTPSFSGGSIATWAEIRAGQSSPQVTDARVFAGCWNNMTFCLWGRGVELLIDAVTMALTGQIKIYANLLCDVGVRYPAAFAVTAAVT
jgi:hypothetical protein